MSKYSYKNSVSITVIALHLVMPLSDFNYGFLCCRFLKYLTSSLYDHPRPVGKKIPIMSSLVVVMSSLVVATVTGRFRRACSLVYYGLTGRMQTLGFSSSTMKLHGQPKLNPKYRCENPALTALLTQTTLPNIRFSILSLSKGLRNDKISSDSVNIHINI